MDKNQASRMNGRQGAAYKYDVAHKTSAATDAALEQELREALKYHDIEHIKSILAHKAHYDAKAYGGKQNPWDYTYDEEAPSLEHAAYEHRITLVGEDNDGHVTKEQAYSEARKEHQYTTYQRAECHLPLPTSNDLKHAKGCRSGFSYGQWSTVYNALSFGIASMGSAMIFVWLMIYNVDKKFRPALGINGLVTGIATYHYFRIFNSWNEAFEVYFDGALGRFVVDSSGVPFNDAYRYVDWLLTVPLLLIELIMVMQLPEGESGRKMWMLGVFSGLMVANGYPGEVQDDPAGRWFYWTLSMLPFTYVLYELYFGLAEATKKHAPSVASLIASARYLTAISWLTYPFVYLLKGIGLGGSDATMAEQVGYSIADVTAKAVFGILIWRIANEKTLVMEEQSLLK
jgi:bacteriorhodopsin